MFFRKKKKISPSPEYETRESVLGTFFYHIALNGNPLCGKSKAETMPTSIPLSAWGVKSHLHEKYCIECEKAYKEKIHA